jgi:4,5-dihydroxyphthalate decarboxylase
LPDKIKLTIALDRYDRHFPFFDGTVPVHHDIELDVKQVGQSVKLKDGSDRHGRMLHQQAYDVCEFSMSTFLMAKARNIPISGIPVFPRRLFSQSQMWVHPDSGFYHPRDLIGKKVALSSFQTTLSLLAKGDLKFHYDVPWEDIHWILTTKEKVDFSVKPGVKVDFIGNRQNLGIMLEKRDIDAFFLPHPPISVMRGETPARRLFEDCQQEEKSYYDSHGDFPIMHIIAIRQSLLEQEPWIATAVMEMFDAAKLLCASYYADPNWSSMAWGRHYFENEGVFFKDDPWENGYERNYSNIERFIQYSHDQAMIDTPYSPELIFAPQTLST